MTKRNLLKWLESERSKAVDKAIEMKQKQLKELRDEYFEKLGVTETATKLLPLFQAIATVLTDYDTNVSDVHKATFNKWGSGTIVRDIPQLTTLLKVREWLEGNTLLGDVPGFAERRRKIIEEANKVDFTYSTVIDAVSNIPTAKLGIQYLEKLGFDPKDIKIDNVKDKKLPAAVSADIDTRYLLLNKSDVEEGSK